MMLADYEKPKYNYALLSLNQPLDNMSLLGRLVIYNHSGTFFMARHESLEERRFFLLPYSIQLALND